MNDLLEWYSAVDLTNMSDLNYSELEDIVYGLAHPDGGLDESAIDSLQKVISCCREGKTVDATLNLAKAVQKLVEYGEAVDGELSSAQAEALAELLDWIS